MEKNAVPDPDSLSPHVTFERERGVHAVQVTRDVTHAVISVGDDEQRPARILQAFRVLSDARVPVFLIKLHRSAVTLAFAGLHAAYAKQALDDAGLKAIIRPGLALVAVRATNMREMHGVMVTIAEALHGSGARLFETGDSHDSVQCLIEGDRADGAVEELCRSFNLDRSAVTETTAMERSS
jgi:aspartate kinase